MASSERQPSASVQGEIPRDALFEVPVRLPAKDLCRLRAVCRSWQTLTSDPLFAAAHKGRHHRDPLLAVDYRDCNNGHGVAIVDLSGKVLKRIPSSEVDIVVKNKSGEVLVMIPSTDDSIIVLCTCLDVVCFTRKFHPMTLWALNPATGVTLELPKSHSDKIAAKKRGFCYGKVESYAFGKISSMGVYKALHIVKFLLPDMQLFEVITVDGTNQGMWRTIQGPPALICSREEMNPVVIDGVVYLLMDFHASYVQTGAMTVEPGSVVLFNFETEKWMGTLRGPEGVRRYVQDSGDIGLKMQLSLIDSNGCLVVVHNIHLICMDFWFLTDSEEGLWVKKFSLPSLFARPSVYPLVVLDDGRVIFRHGENGTIGSVVSYDSRTGSHGTVFQLSRSSSRHFATYTGNLLSSSSRCY
uniref:F-box domain-containing protein n=2 Tax=Oryza brachyantha TaxID=4533 RepID=J3MJ92_ORYBR